MNSTGQKQSLLSSVFYTTNDYHSSQGRKIEIY